MGTRQETPETAADDEDVDLVGERLAIDALARERVVDEVGELRGHLDVLIVPVGAQPLVALLPVLVPERVQVQICLAFAAS